MKNSIFQTIGGKKSHCASTRALDSILNVDDEEYKYLDPKIMRPVEGQPKSRQPISQAILFMIGGGSYIEYQVSSNLSLSEETAENAISN